MPHTMTRTFHALLAVVAALLVVAAPASAAKTEREFFGLNLNTAGDALVEGDVPVMKSAKVGVVRVAIEWQVVQPEKGGPMDWSYFDRLYSRAARAGVRVLPILSGAPKWVQDQPHYPPRTPEKIAAFSTFVRAAVDRYGRGGDFWTQNRTVPSKPSTMWQVWNEPNLAYWWEEKPDAKEYLTLLRSTSRAIRGGDSKAKVVLGGLPETNGIPMNEYLTRLYKASPKFKTYFDVLAIHPFGRGWPGVEGALYRLRQVTKKYKDDKTPVIITEIGWATGGGKDADFQVTSPKGQSDRLRSTFRNVVKNRKKWNVAGIVWYAYRDLVPGDWWIMNCGLFDRSGKAKPAWSVFRSFSKNTK